MTVLSIDPAFRMLAIDVSSVCVGWAVFDGTELTAWGKYHQDGAEHGEKLSTFARWLRAMLTQHAPTVLVTEMPYAGRRKFTYGILMLYLSVILRVHFEAFGEEMPSTGRFAAHAVKRALQMKRSEGSDRESAYEQTKRKMINHINKVYGLDLRWKARDKTKRVSDDDTADAIALGRAYLLARGYLT